MSVEKFVTYNEIHGQVKSFSDIIGKIPIKVKQDDTRFKLWFSPETYVVLYHEQDCCESVYIDDVCGDINDLVGERLLVAEEVSVELPAKHKYDDSYTWTFYRFATNKGDVTVKWYGTSNGYYSESVSIEIVCDGEEIHEY